MTSLTLLVAGEVSRWRYASIIIRRVFFVYRFATVATLLAGLAGCGDSARHEAVGESSLALSANDKTAYDYFISQGLSGVQAAGILGNLDVESGMDPTSVESGGPGRGIAQWSAGGRWDTTANDNVIDYATMKGEDHLSLNLQLEFIWYELTTFPDYGLAKLRAATTVTDAVDAFESAYEGCSACNPSSRASDAQSALAAYGADVPTDGGTSTSDGGPSAPACVVASSGASGECISTASCAALGDHMSTPGFCPGAADIQCCTASGSESGGSGGGGGSSSSSSSGNGGSNDSSGGCSAASRAPSGGAAFLLLLGMLVVKRRRPTKRARVSRVG